MKKVNHPLSFEQPLQPPANELMLRLQPVEPDFSTTDKVHWHPGLVRCLAETDIPVPAKTVH